MEFSHILVATDLSDESRQALPYAAAFARRYGGAVSLIYVDEWDQPGLFHSVQLTDYSEARSQRIEAELEDERAKLANSGLNVTSYMASGKAHQEIVRFVEEHHIDLVVLTRHGSRAMRHLLIGSTTKRVLRHSPVPTLVVPVVEQDEEASLWYTGFQHMLATTDFSEDSRVGLTNACALAERFGARVTLVHVYSGPEKLLLSGMALPDDIRAELCRVEREELESWCSSVPGIEITPHMELTSNAARGVVAAAESLDVDLIALPSHGKGAVRSVLMGSTSEQVVNLAAVPVLVMPRGDGEHSGAHGVVTKS